MEAKPDKSKNPEKISSFQNTTTEKMQGQMQDSPN